MKISVDLDSGAAYVHFKDGNVSSTVEVNDSLFVDRDEFDVVLGLEVLDLTAPVPIEQLLRDFHFQDGDADELRRRPPAFSSFGVRHFQGTDTTLDSGPQALLTP